MKKLILLLLIISSLFILNIKGVNAYDFTHKFTSFDGSTIELYVDGIYKDYKYESYIKYKDTVISIKEISNSIFDFVGFFEDSTRMFLYGSYRNKKGQFYPFIIKLIRNKSYYHLFLPSLSFVPEELTGQRYVVSALSTIDSQNIYYCLEEGVYPQSASKVSNLICCNDDFETISKVSIEAVLEHGYDETFIYTAKDSVVLYYSKDEEYQELFKFSSELGEYNSTERFEVEGYFTLPSTSIVNGVRAIAGSSFSSPGVYKIYPELATSYYIVVIVPTIEGVSDCGIYDSLIEYKVSGGSVYINGEKSGQNGICKAPGIYVLEVKDKGIVIKSITFKILPYLITSISGPIDVGTKIYFYGNGLLDGEEISNGCVLDKTGAHTLTLYLESSDLSSDSLTKVYYFSVVETTITKTNKKVKFIVVEIVLGFILLSILSFLLIRKKKRHTLIKKQLKKNEIEKEEKLIR